MSREQRHRAISRPPYLLPLLPLVGSGGEGEKVEEGAGGDGEGVRDEMEEGVGDGAGWWDAEEGEGKPVLVVRCITIRVYSGTSNKGPSEIRMTSLQGHLLWHHANIILPPR